MKILIISCSLNPDSRSARMAELAAADFEASQADVTYVDLRQYPLPMCDGHCSNTNERAVHLSQMIEAADAVLLAVPIYNYDVNAAAKNLIELTGKAWNDKVVAFLCAAGGRSSYMSVMSLANSLMLDFRCVIVPRFVYACGNDFENRHTVSATVRERIALLTQAIWKTAKTQTP